MIKYLGMTPEDAEIELGRIGDERKNDASARVVDIDWANLGA